MMEDYLLNLRKEVGNRPLVVAGVSIIVLKKEKFYLLNAVITDFGDYQLDQSNLMKILKMLFVEN